MLDREQISAQMEEQLKKIREQLDVAKEKAVSSGKTLLEYSKGEVGKLEAKYEEARYQLTLLRNSSDSAWVDLRQGFENAYRELKEALNKAKEKF